MKKLLAAGAVAGFVLLGAGMAPASAVQSENQVCEDYGFGKIEMADGTKTLTIEAPKGYAIMEVCVKAGSAKHGGGAETTTYYYAHSVEITGPLGKDISHYSVKYRSTGNS